MTFAEGLSLEIDLDDQGFKVYFDLMLGLLLNTLFFIALFKHCASMCVLQSIIQPKLVFIMQQYPAIIQVFCPHSRQK